ncbi:MAG: hypothetical protein AAF264_08760 [Pseudomonadota bacterium]
MSEDLTGQWIGRYAYALGGAAVPFEAELIHWGGALEGRTVEPNTFRTGAGPELTADIAGSVDGGFVAFTKRYRDRPGEGRPTYEGRLLLNGLRIEGLWRLARPDWLTGSFTMVRTPRAAVRAARRASVEAPS